MKRSSFSKTFPEKKNLYEIKCKSDMFKTVILDFDGTIGDTKSLIVATMQQTIKRLGLPARTSEQCASMIGLPLRQTFTNLIPMTDEMGDLCDRIYTELFYENNQPGVVPLFPHVRNTIREMYVMGVTICVASSRKKDSLMAFLKEMKLSHLVSVVVSADDVTNAKPATDMVDTIMRHVDCSPEEVLVVGDTKYDIQMGKAAGTKTCAVTYGNGTRSDFSEADYIINDFSKLLDIV